ncbi:hypothetical protein N0V93_003958 [Gnomoniopsis smithogilvyi]|uniref:Uncharacterized protein n=1 Tax=Gnomoniopsis smithogilvyi TaxID=1191159 RepID=A0A9W9D0L2_9PEZI|nr:hypothetical protein N0V93_003958 [Gnomoniopsis smithogilvyi]
MAAAAETVQSIQKALEPYIRPREEVEQIRRILALNLRSCYENGPQSGPLALAEPDCTIKTTDVRGLQRDYLKALHANIKAQREYESVSQQQVVKEVKDAKLRNSKDGGRLEDQITAIKLRRKRERLQTVDKYINQLAQKPAASPEFLQSEEIFQSLRRLPEVPKTVVSSFTVDKSSTKTDLKALVDRLEKAVLRSKLLLRKEEQLLEQVKARSTVSPGQVSECAKLAALKTTRNELISWMETELSKASAVEEPDPEEAGRGEAKVDKAHLDKQLALIRGKYVEYVAARKSLVQLVAQSPQSPTKLQQEAMATEHSEVLPPPPPLTTHLITPYIENLLSVAHEQKAAITQKSHFTNVLTKQSEDIGKALVRLADESQLLPEHPTRRRQERLGGDSLDKRGHEITTSVQSWVSAADSAKLATLETIAEKIEEGQIALEGSTKYLAEIDQLLGRTVGVPDESVDGDTSMDDIWLTETQTPRKGSKAPAKSKSDATKGPKDVWSLLDGNLGLINAEDSPRK